MLSLKEINKKSIPIALYNDKSKKFIYFTNKFDLNKKSDFDSDSDSDSDNEYNMFDPSVFLKQDFFRKMSKRKQVETLIKLKDLFENKKYSLSQDDIFKKSKKFIKSEMKNEIVFKNNNVEIIPYMDKRQIIYIAGPSGVGKSYITAKYAEKYHKLFPDNKIFLFSKKGKDELFDEKKYIKRVDIDEELFENEIDVDLFKNSLVIFDDAHTYRGKIEKGLIYLQADLMNLGRSDNVNMVITSHLLTDYKKTRDILNELTGIVIYPHGTSYHQIRYALLTHFGLDKKQIQKIMKLNSRWVYINKFPRYIIYEKGIYLI